MKNIACWEIRKSSFGFPVNGTWWKKRLRRLLFGSGLTLFDYDQLINENSPKECKMPISDCGTFIENVTWSKS